MDAPTLPLQQIGGLLFMMTGPLKVVPTFAALTSKLPASEKSAIARKAVFIAMIALSLAIFVGPGLMKSWGASQQAVSAAAGLLLAIASLQSILGTASAPAQEIGERSLAISPLAFPTLVPPYAVGVLVLFAANFSQTGHLLQMVGLAIAMMLLDWLAMTFAAPILRVLGPTTLKVLGSVFGVLQLSLGVEMIFYAMKSS
jgi:multiple antibiotic resistance protein